MPKRKPSSPPGPAVGEPTVDAATGVRLLQDLVAKATALEDPSTEEAYDQWKLIAKNILGKVFGENHHNVTDVIGYGSNWATVMTANMSREYLAQRARERNQQRLAGQVSRIEGLIKVLETECELQAEGIVGAMPSLSTGRRIFLVHGHDSGLVETVARFLERLGQDVTILREEPNAGRTIIEKFEDHAEGVGFAVVLLTPDDRGGTVDVPFDDQKERARQNVILELGFFLGTLTRARVCALYVEGVEIPSDYDGVLFVPLDDNGAWRMALSKELKTAGFDIDMNDAL